MTAVSNKMIEEHLDQYIFDGQFMDEFPQDEIRSIYIQEMKKGYNHPDIIQKVDGDLYFSWRNEVWDSAQLNLNVKRVDYISKQCHSVQQFNQLVERVPEKDLVYFRLPTRHPLDESLKRSQYIPYAQKIMMKKKIKGIGVEDECVCLLSDIENKEKAIGAIQTFAQDAFEQNRFKRDPKLPRDFYKRVYRSWVESRLDHCENILCVLDEEKMVGFLMYRVFNLMSRPCALVELVAVARNVQGKGVSSRLQNHFEHILVSNNIYLVYANTDSENIQGLKFFKRHGFKEFHTISEYHWWRSE